MGNCYISVAIDGPAGAGKSTIARAVAERLGFVYMDTGAIYRTMGCYFAMCGIGPKDTDGIRRLINDVTVQIRYDDAGMQRMLLNGRDVTEEIRTPEMSEYASRISSQAVVREYLLEMQRDMARHHNVIMDGRDIGTVVLPKAQIKLFLTAPLEVRANRRFLEFKQKGKKLSLEQVMEEVRLRDEADQTREISPLRKAADAIVLDTGTLSLEESIAAVEALIRERASL